ncbi:MAG: glycosyltransferase [Acidimicrobiia bacterium]
MPVAGVVWQTLHYLLGFERLGCETFYVEAHGRAPQMLMRAPDDDAPAAAAAFLSSTLAPYGFGDRWAYHDRDASGLVFGMSDAELQRLYADAAMIVNLHGGTRPLDEHVRGERLVLVQTDPVQLEVELHGWIPESHAFAGAHAAWFSFAELLGQPGCGLPVPPYPVQPTRQPVLLDLWSTDARPGDAWTTVGNWKQGGREVAFDGRWYGWSKHDRWHGYLDLPERTGARFTPALSRIDSDDRRALQRRGWTVLDAVALSSDVETYRAFVHGSLGEFTVAKEQNVALRTGWFSDRSATYLASGRPVVTEDTGFGDVFGRGPGLHAFRTLDEALAAVQEVHSDPDGASRAARELAREFFAHDVVLRPILDAGGINLQKRTVSSPPPFPDDLVLEPVGRRPLTLPTDTIDRVAQQARPRSRHAREPLVALVVVTHDNLTLLRLGLETLLAAPASGPPFEVFVFDNGSRPDTLEYLDALTSEQPIVRAVHSGTNIGFAAAVNAAIPATSAPSLVIINDDVIAPPGWLGPLLTHLREDGIGAVGPCTNRIGTASEILTSYRTYGELVAFARERRQRFSGGRSPVDMLPMFCLALRRRVFDRVGPLDERYGVGLFEDDDYSRRLRAAGLRLARADDVFVHHFGEGSFGRLVPSGEYSDLFERNRRLFESKWGEAWAPHRRETEPAYETLCRAVRQLVAERLPTDAPVGVVSRGDDALVAHGRRPAWHVPHDASGRWAGCYPADEREALVQLHALRAGGARFLVVPAPSRWWFDRYPALDRLDTVVDDDACRIVALDGIAP